ncbi:MAG: T9SS type A sorting domain-containing protein [Candidatus Kapaibacterium sp.]
MKRLFSFLLVLFTVFFLAGSANAQLTGTKTIPGDYATITEAVTDLNTVGVGAGGVTFNVAAGFTENTTAEILITATGTSGNLIIFQKSGAGANPIVTRTDAGVNTTTALGALGDAVIRLNGSDFITFDAIDVAASQSTIEYGYFTSKTATDGCFNVTIKNSLITMTKGTSAYVMGIYIGNGTISTSSATGVTVTAHSGRNAEILITGNTIQNVHAGIYVRGSSATGFQDSIVTVGQSGAGNIIQNFGGGSATTTYGVYFIYVISPSVDYNTINNAGGGGSAHASTLYGIFYSSGIRGDVVGSNNAITLANSSTSSATNYILNGNTVTSEVFSNNTFGAGTISSTGTVYLLSLSNSTTNKTVSGNTISGTINRTGASGTFYCYYNNGSPGSGAENVYNNIFNNITLAGTSPFYGFSSTTATGGTQNIYNNTISNINLVTGTFYGTNLTIANTRSVYGNTVHTISSTGTIYGFSLGSGSSSGLIFKNKIYNLSSSATGSLVYGMYITSGTLVNIYNNYISDLKAPSATGANAVAGIYISGGTAVNLYYNTVYLNASGGATFGSSGIYKSSTTTSEFRNNVIVNVSTPGSTSGNTVALRWSGVYNPTYYTSTSNNNDFYAGTPAANSLIYFDGTNSDQTIGAYKTRVASRDAASFTELPPFVNVATTPYDLHIQTTIPTQLEKGGSPVTTPIAITDDYDGNIRNATLPDVGADEGDFTPLDLTAPTIAYTPLGNTSGTGSRVLTAAITDGTGVPTAGAGLPVLYWGINNIAGPFASATGTYVSGNQYDFSFGTGAVAGDIIYYYIVAQDIVSTPNVGAYPSAGAAGFTANPPFASTPPTTPSSYIITAAPLTGDYTVGTAMFNKVTGKNITFEKVVTKVIIDEPVYSEPIKGNNGESKIISYKKTEVDEISWIPMENGRKYAGELYIKKSENPSLNYSSGTEGIYATITAAIADLNLRGVSGPVRFLLTDASYTAGETYPLTIDITSGDVPTAVNTVTIKPNSGVVAGISGASTSSIFKLDGADYITIDGSNTVGGTTKDLTIENTSTTGSISAIWFASKGVGAGAAYNTIKNCNVKTGLNSLTTSFGVYFGGATIGTAGSDNDNNTIQNNYIYKAYYGIDIFGTTGSTSDNINLIGNTIGAPLGTTTDYIYKYGIYGTHATGCTISQNTVQNITNSSGTLYGMYFTTGFLTSTISRNNITNIYYSGSGGYGGWGIYTNSGSATSSLTFDNNMISEIKGDGYSSFSNSSPVGMYFDGTTGGLNIYYNSVYLSGTFTRATATITTAILFNTSTITNVDLRDNIFVNGMDNIGMTTDKNYAIYSSAPLGSFTNINNNDYYVSGPQGVFGYLGGDVADLAAWKTATGQDANSVSGDPKFTSNTDLHIIPTEVSPVHNAGTPIAGITTDFDGNTRNVTTPDIGADEYTYAPPSVDPPTDFTATPFSGSQINLGWNLNATSQPIIIAVNSSATFGDPINGQAYNVDDIIAGGGTIIYNGSDLSFGHSGLSFSTHYYYKAFSFTPEFDPSLILYSPGVSADATTLCGVTTAPFVQDFELAAFPPNCWTVDGLSNGWARSTSASGYGTGTASTFVNFYGLSSGSREMTTFEFNTSALTTPLLKFDHAYATYSGENDQLRIDYSTNGGTDWTQLVLYDGGTSGPLNTGGAVNTVAFVPTAAQWATKSVNLPALTNKVKFVGISAYGNNLYVDNIMVIEAPTLPIFSISPESKAFGNIAIGGGSVDQTFTITNTGGGTLTINNTDFTLTGTDPAQFQILGATTLNLGAGESGTVRVQFIPNTTIGDKSANLHIVDNLAKSLHDIPLTGTSVVNPAQSLLGGLTVDYKPSLTWQAPAPGSEIKIDDGTVEGNYWLSSPSNTNQYFSNKLTVPHAGNLTQIAISAYSTTAGNMFNSVLVCPDDGTGKPNLAAPYETFSSVGVGTSSAWIFLTLTSPLAVTAGQTFYIVVQWPAGSTTGPYVGTDMTVLNGRSFYSVDAGANWTDAPGNFFMRAYMGTSGDNLISGVTPPESKNIPVITLTEKKSKTELKETSKKENIISVPAALIYGKNGEKVLSSYTVKRGTVTGVYTQDFTGISALTYDDNSAVLGTRYYYVVDAVYTEGTSAHSNEVSVLPQNPNYGTFSNGLGGFYKFSNSTASGSPESKPIYNWEPTTDFTTLTFADLDDGSMPVDFSATSKLFKFFGVDYNTVNVNANGYLTFGAAASDWTPAGALPQVGDPANMIAVAFRDLYIRTTYTPASSVSYKIFTDKIVISYNNIYDRTGADGTNYISVQIALYISTAPALNSLCVINYNDEMSYAPLATNTIVTLASLGLNGPGGTVGFNYRYLGLGGPMFDGVALSPNGANAMALGFGDQDAPLPVSLSSFTSSINGRDVRLSWKTESETNNAGFEVERSESGVNQWVKAGYVSGKGTISTTTSYAFEDKKLNSGKYNYRLKQIDNNGNFEYHALSNVVEVGLPTKYELSQNYPNPFNPVTKIDFSLPFDSKVSIKLYDITGREVKTLVNEARTAGYYTVQFNASDLSSGTYFYRIMTKSSGADYIMTKKMMLIK